MVAEMAAVKRVMLLLYRAERRSQEALRLDKGVESVLESSRFLRQWRAGDVAADVAQLDERGCDVRLDRAHCAAEEGACALDCISHIVGAHACRASRGKSEVGSEAKVRVGDGLEHAWW